MKDWLLHRIKDAKKTGFLDLRCTPEELQASLPHHSQLDNDSLIFIVAELKKHPEITGVDLAGNQLNDKDIEIFVKELQRLAVVPIYLGLGHNHITDIGATRLASLKGLQALDIQHNDIKDLGVNTLSCQPSLIWLNSSNNFVLIKTLDLIRFNIEKNRQNYLATVKSGETVVKRFLPSLIKNLVDKLTQDNSRNAWLAMPLVLDNQKPLIEEASYANNSIISAVVRRFGQFSTALFVTATGVETAVGQLTFSTILTEQVPYFLTFYLGVEALKRYHDKSSGFSEITQAISKGTLLPDHAFLAFEAEKLAKKAEFNHANQPQIPHRAHSNPSLKTASPLLRFHSLAALANPSAAHLEKPRNTVQDNHPENFKPTRPNV